MESSEKDERKKRIIFFKISYSSIYVLCFSIRTIGRNIRDMLRNDRSNEFIEDTTFAPLFTIHVIEIFIAIFIIFQEWSNEFREISMKIEETSGVRKFLIFFFFKISHYTREREEIGKYTALGWKNIFSAFVIWEHREDISWWLLIWHFCPDRIASAERGITYSMHIVCTEISVETRLVGKPRFQPRGNRNLGPSDSRILLKKKNNNLSFRETKKSLEIQESKFTSNSYQ